MCHFASLKANFTAANQLAKSSKPKFRKFTIQLVKIFIAAKHFVGTHVLFCNLKIQFRNCEPSCEITSNLRKCQSSFKFLFKPFILSFLISHSHSNLRSPKISEDPLQRKPRSHAPEEHHSARLRVPCGTRASPFQP